MSGLLDAEVIEAAGGIVECHTPDGTRIAVIHRSRYGGEWGLPKGKRKPDETWQQTALREVEEEIGSKAIITGIAGSTMYLVQGRPKLVVYWRMRIDAEVPPFVPNDEVTNLAWLPAHEATKRLTHAEEQDVVRTAFPRSGRRWWKIVDCLDRLSTCILRRRALARLTADIAAYQAELACRCKCARTIDVLEAAERAVRNCDIDGGWKYLQTARRLELAAADPHERDAAAIAIRKEAEEKLKGWRKDAVNDLLAACSGTTRNWQQVCLAARLCDEHFNNEAYKDGLRRSNALILASCLLATVVLLFWIACKKYLSAVIDHSAVNVTADNNLFKVLLSLAVVGWLGATVSAITGAPKAGASRRIPELVSDVRVTMLRLLMGPASAIVLYFATQSDLFRAVFSVDASQGAVLLVVAFAAGFSERLVLRVAAAIDPKPDK